jgi:hypothetical protein
MSIARVRLEVPGAYGPTVEFSLSKTAHERVSAIRRATPTTPRDACRPLRAVLDWYIARLEPPEPEDRDVQDIPVE